MTDVATVAARHVVAGSISRGELRLLALAAVNDELSRAIQSIAGGHPIRLSGLSFQDRIRLKEMAMENEFAEKGISIVV